jgi:hypothetical protein
MDDYITLECCKATTYWIDMMTDFVDKILQGDKLKLIVISWREKGKPLILNLPIQPSFMSKIRDIFILC